MKLLHYTSGEVSEVMTACGRDSDNLRGIDTFTIDGRQVAVKLEFMRKRKGSWDAIASSTGSISFTRSDGSEIDSFTLCYISKSKTKAIKELRTAIKERIASGQYTLPVQAPASVPQASFEVRW